MLAAFAAVYVVWGSTYLAIRIVVRDMPPALSAGARFVVAGLLLLVWSRRRGEALPASLRDWLRLAGIGIAMLTCGNGLVVWSEQWVPSNEAALLVATAALWMAGFGALGPNGHRPTPLAIGGLLLGFAGVAVLVGEGLRAALAPLPAYLALLTASLVWAGASVYAKRYPVKAGPLTNSGVQMFCAGALLLVIGVGRGEQAHWHWTLPATLALAYLIVFGSCVAYLSYQWLVHEISPSLLGTYAYVNPAVAVVLGGLILDERLTASQWLGTGIILLAVVLVTLAGRAPVAKVAAAGPE